MNRILLGAIWLSSEETRRRGYLRRVGKFHGRLEGLIVMVGHFGGGGEGVVRCWRGKLARIDRNLDFELLHSELA